MRRAKKKNGRSSYASFREKLAIVSIIIILFSSYKESLKMEGLDVSTAMKWLRVNNDAEANSTTTTLSTVDRPQDTNSVSVTIPEWPSKPVSTLQQDPEAMRLLRIGQGGPVDDAKLFFEEHFEEFLQIYRNRPDKSNICGIRIDHSLAIYTIAKRLQPTTIVESGVNSGQSTYFFRKACPNVKIISLDPLEKPICGQPIRWIDNTNNEYLTAEKFQDFNQIDWKGRIAREEIDPATTLVFLDDHQGFRTRIAALLQHGFRHVINEDNYLLGQGATGPDRANLAPKQMWRLPDDPETKWLHSITNYYAEFPPLVPPSAAQGTPHAKKVQGGFLHLTDNLLDMEEPLLRPDVNEKDNELFQRLATELQFDKTLVDSMSYQNFMGYCYICYLELAVMPPSLRQAWQATL